MDHHSRKKKGNQEKKVQTALDWDVGFLMQPFKSEKLLPVEITIKRNVHWKHLIGVVKS